MSNPTPNLTRANDAQIREQIRQIAAQLNWLEAVSNDYPAPIAHEYQRLRAVLEDGLMVTAVMQLKDVVEVLFKFPAVVMAQWVLTQGSDADLQQKTQTALLGKKMALGDWQRLADNLAVALVRCEQAEIASLAQWFRVRPPQATGKAKKHTQLHSLLNELINWRNDAVGHGALRLEVEEYLPELENYIRRLNIQLAALPDGWQAAQLRTVSGEVLQGAASFRQRHEQQATQPHSEETVDLLWHLANGQDIPLSPLLSLRRCLVCSKQDLFFFDSRDGKENKYRLAFLDYLAGHKMQRPGHTVPALAEPLREMSPEPLLADSDVVGGAYLKQSLDRLLQEKSLEAEYLSPTYLRTPLANFIQTHERGVFWLQAPAHVGKSLFVQGLAAEAELDEPLLDDLAVVTFHIRRDYRYHLPLFISQLRRDFEKVLDVQAGSQKLPEFDHNAADVAQAFAAWIAAWLTVYQQVHGQPQAQLLVCLDGLDEMTLIESPHLLDLLPAPAQLAKGCYVLLTSRPPAECAPELRPYLARLHQPQPDLSGFTVDTQNTAYLALLRDYFDARVKQGNDEIFAQVLERGERRFLYVSLLCDLLRDLLRDSRLTQAQVADLPKGKGLYEFYVKQMESVLGVDSKQWAFFRRVLLLLAAAELTALKEDRLLASVGGVREAAWQGLPLAVLAEWLGESSAQAARLVFALSSLKTVLRVERRSLSSSHYRLGLKGLTTFLRKYWASELAAEQGRLVRVFYTDWQERFADLGDLDEQTDAVVVYQLRSLPAQAALSGDTVLREKVFGDAGLASVFWQRGWNNAEQADYAKAVMWYSAAAVLYQSLFKQTAVGQWQNNLATAYNNRGNALKGQGELSAAVADYQQAIDLGEALRNQRAAQQQAWPPEWQNDLAMVYLNRGTALAAQGELSAALADYQQAIDLREALRRQLTAQQQALPPAWQNDLAGAYSNRGNALYAQGELSAALADFKQAIDLREALRRQLTAQQQAWPPEWQNNLATAYSNRGAALQDQGELSAAVADFQQAIDLREALRRQLAAQQQAWPPEWQNDLASVYNNRGNALYAQRELSAAVADFQQAIELMKSLRSQRAAQQQALPPEWQNNLAAAYSNRGNALQDQGDFSAAVADYQQAIDLGEALRRQLAAQQQAWPPEWQNDLAKAYSNRGAALKAQGDLSAAVADYQRAIGLQTQLLLVQQFMPVIPDLARVYINLVLASRHPQLPASLNANSLQQSAQAFLRQLAETVDVQTLPAHWVKEIQQLERVLQGTIPYAWWQKLLLIPVWNPVWSIWQRKLFQDMQTEDIPSAMRTPQAIEKMQALKNLPMQPVNYGLFYALMPIWLPLLVLLVLPVFLGKVIWTFRKQIGLKQILLVVFSILLLLLVLLFYLLY